MRRIQIKIDSAWGGCVHYDVITVPDDTTDQQICDHVDDITFTKLIHPDWEELEDDDPGIINKAV